MKKKNYNKIFAMLLVVLTLVGAFVCPQVFQSSETSKADAAGYYMVVVTANDAALRQYPAAGSTMLTTYNMGKCLTYNSYPVSDWYYVSDGTNNGYINTSVSRLVFTSNTKYITSLATSGTAVRNKPVQGEYLYTTVAYGDIIVVSQTESIKFCYVIVNDEHIDYYAKVHKGTNETGYICIGYTNTGELGASGFVQHSHITLNNFTIADIFANMERYVA